MKQFQRHFGKYLKTRKFSIFICAIFLARFIRIKEGYIASTFSGMTAELTGSLSDFIFSCFVDGLIEDLKRISSNNVESVKLKVFLNLKALKKIEKIYSVPLTITIFYNFILMIVSCYWFIIRIGFGHLKSLNGK